jgi:predicted nucleic acid-binding Zn ribbon protein
VQKTSSLLEPLIAKLGIAEGVRLARLKTDWDEIFDKPLSLHMWPSKFAEGTLLLNVDSALWIHQLTYHKNAILEKLRAYGVRDIRFRVGRLSRSATRLPDARRLREMSGEDSTFISSLVSGIGDAELREAIKGAAEKSLRAETEENKGEEK